MELTMYCKDFLGADRTGEIRIMSQQDQLIVFL